MTPSPLPTRALLTTTAWLNVNSTRSNPAQAAQLLSTGDPKAGIIAAVVHPECLSRSPPGTAPPSPPSRRPAWLARLRPRAPPPPPPPAWCDGTARWLKRRAAFVAAPAVRLAVVSVATLDAPMAFFTGVADVRTGLLAPPPPIARWLYPGLASQLLSSPALHDVADALHFVGDRFTAAAGGSAARALRWGVWLWPVARLVLATLSFECHFLLYFATSAGVWAHVRKYGRYGSWFFHV